MPQFFKYHEHYKNIYENIKQSRRVRGHQASITAEVTQVNREVQGDGLAPQSLEGSKGMMQVAYNITEVLPDLRPHTLY